jgi:hypothetical protein
MGEKRRPIDGAAEGLSAAIDIASTAFLNHGEPGGDPSCPNLTGKFEA